MYKYKNLQVGQVPQKHLSFLQNLLNFIITKCLKQEVDDDLSLCIDKHSPCSLSITGDIKDLPTALDQKGIMSKTPMGKCHIDFYHEVAFTVQI